MRKKPTGRPPSHGAYSLMISGEIPSKRRRYIRPYLQSVREGLIRDHGPTEESLTTGQKVLIDRVVTALGVIRLVEEHGRSTGILDKGGLKPPFAVEYIRYIDLIRRCLVDLGIDKKASAEALDLKSYLSKLDAEGKGPDSGSKEEAIVVPGASYAHGDGKGESFAAGKDDSGHEDLSDE